GRFRFGLGALGLALAPDRSGFADAEQRGLALDVPVPRFVGFRYALVLAAVGGALLVRVVQGWQVQVVMAPVQLAVGQHGLLAHLLGCSEPSLALVLDLLQL